MSFQLQNCNPWKFATYGTHVSNTHTRASSWNSTFHHCTIMSIQNCPQRPIRSTAWHHTHAPWTHAHVRATMNSWRGWAPSFLNICSATLTREPDSTTLTCTRSNQPPHRMDTQLALLTLKDGLAQWPYSHCSLHNEPLNQTTLIAGFTTGMSKCMGLLASHEYHVLIHCLLIRKGSASVL